MSAKDSFGARATLEVGGREWADRYLAKVQAEAAESKPAGLGPNRDFGTQLAYTAEERRNARRRRGPWWGMPVANPADCASPYLPNLLVSRLEELGMDYLITYPTWGLTVHTIPDTEDRLIATRAVNLMHSRVWNGVVKMRLVTSTTIAASSPGPRTTDTAENAI